MIHPALQAALFVLQVSKTVTIYSNAHIMNVFHGNLHCSLLSRDVVSLSIHQTPCFWQYSCKAWMDGFAINCHCSSIVLPARIPLLGTGSISLRLETFQRPMGPPFGNFTG
jgi:hypothetical protein